MESQTIETPETVSTVTESAAVAPKQSRIAAMLATVKAAPKWVLMTVPALLVAGGGYAYLHHGAKSGDSVAAVNGQQVAMVAPEGQPQGFVPVAYDQGYGPAYYGPGYGNYGRGDAYGNGNGYGRGYGHGHGNGRARGNFSFSMGGDMDGSSSAYGDNRYDGYGAGNNRWSGNRGWW
jgi:hypothetical protein